MEVNLSFKLKVSNCRDDHGLTTVPEYWFDDLKKKMEMEEKNEKEEEEEEKE